MELIDTTFRNYYFSVQTRMLKDPRRVFSEHLPQQGVKRSLGVLLTSGITYSLACMLISRPEAYFVHGIVLLVNALGMVFIAAAIGYGLIGMITGRWVPFPRLLSIYALSSGITLLVAWLPFSLWFTEPWKWWLIGAGLTGSFAIKRSQALVIIIGSIVILTLLFGAFLP